VVQLLLQKGADIDSKDSGYHQTPLSLAAWSGRAAVVQLLLKKGADVDSTSYYGRTPLSYAAESGHAAVVKLLLEEAVDVDSNNSSSQTLLVGILATQTIDPS
jgi:ankyrin repeat protein